MCLTENVPFAVAIARTRCGVTYFIELWNSVQGMCYLVSLRSAASSTAGHTWYDWILHVHGPPPLRPTHADTQPLNPTAKRVILFAVRETRPTQQQCRHLCSGVCLGCLCQSFPAESSRSLALRALRLRVLSPTNHGRSELQPQQQSRIKNREVNNSPDHNGGCTAFPLL